jgi:hypothetical protein
MTGHRIDGGVQIGQFDLTGFEGNLSGRLSKLEDRFQWVTCNKKPEPLCSKRRIGDKL